MEATRRQMFALMGAAPVAVKSVTDKLAAGLAAAQTPSVGHAPIAGMSRSNSAPAEARKSLLQGVLDTIPGWKRHEVMQRARWDRTKLDPDLATMASMSLSARYTIQQDRLYNRYLDDERAELRHMVERDGFWSKLSALFDGKTS
ncbi:MAG: hypothetical protein AAFY06_00140 [Pseudomonadota bacterium]